MSNQTISEGPRNGSLWWWQPDADSPLLEALKRTRLDGLKEALKPNIHVINRIFWTCVFLLCANWGGYLTIDAVKDLLQHSVRYDTYEATPVKDTPWASAIFCPQFMLSKSKIKEAKTLQEFVDEDGGMTTYKNVSWSRTDIQILYTFIHLSCDAGDSFFPKVGVNLEEIFPNLYGDGYKPIKIMDNPNDEVIMEKIIPFLQEGLVHCNEIVKACSWNGEDIEDCSSILKPVQTDVGTCCGFNSIPDHILKKKPSLRSLLNGKNIKTDGEYNKWINYTIDQDPHLFPNPYQVDRSSDVPKRQQLAGPEHGLSLVLGISNNAKHSMCPISDGSGVLMAVVDPLDEPQMLKNGFYVKPNHETLVKIRSKFIKASQGMQAMDKDARKCYLGRENILEQYAKYTEYNCQLECQANVIEKRCRCIPIDLSYGNNNSIICGTEKKGCIREAKLHLASEGFEKLEVCKNKKCYKSCNRIEYKETLSSSVISEEMIYEAKKHLKISPEMDLFVIHAFQAEDSTPTEVGKEAYSFIQIIGDVFGILGFTIGMTIITPFLILYALGYYIIAKLRMYLWFQNCYNPAFIPPNQRANEPVTEVESVVDGDNQSENGNEGGNQDPSAITSASDNQSEDGSGNTESNAPNPNDQEGNGAVGELEDADSDVPSSDGQNEDKDENEGTGNASVDEDGGESSDAVPKDQKDDENKEPDAVAPFSDNQNENEEADDKSIDENQIEDGEEDIISIPPDSEDQKQIPAEDENAVVPFVPEDNAQSDNDAETDPKYTTWADIQNQDEYVEWKFKHVTLDLSPESQRRLQIFIKTSSDSCSILVGPNPKSPTPKRSPPSSPSHSSPKQEESSLVTSPSPADSKDEKPVTEDNNKIRQITVMPKNDPNIPNPIPEENDQSPNNSPSSEIKTLTSKPEEIPGPSFHVSRLGPKMNRPSNSFSRHVTKDDMELTEVVVEPRYKRPATSPSSIEVRVPNPNPQVQPLPDVEEVEDDGPWTAERILKLWKS